MKMKVIFGINQVLRTTCKGRQKQIPAYGDHATVNLLGGVNIETGFVWKRINA